MSTRFQISDFQFCEFEKKKYYIYIYILFLRKIVCVLSPRRKSLIYCFASFSPSVVVGAPSSVGIRITLLALSTSTLTIYLFRALHAS